MIRLKTARTVTATRARAVVERRTIEWPTRVLRGQHALALVAPHPPRRPPRPVLHLHKQQRRLTHRPGPRSLSLSKWKACWLSRSTTMSLQTACTAYSSATMPSWRQSSTTYRATPRQSSKLHLGHHPWQACSRACAAPTQIVLSPLHSFPKPLPQRQRGDWLCDFPRAQRLLSERKRDRSRLVLAALTALQQSVNEVGTEKLFAVSVVEQVVLGEESGERGQE